MATLVQIATMGMAVDAPLDQRFAAALCDRAATVLQETPPGYSMEVESRVHASRRRSFAWVVLKDPVRVALMARWVLAAAPLPVLATYLVGGQVAVTDAQLSQAATALWDYLAEA